MGEKLIYVFTFLIVSVSGFTQNEPVKIYDFHQDKVNSVDFSPDAKLLASGSDDGTVQITDMTTGAIRLFMKDHQEKVNTVEFSRDGRYLYSASENKVIVVDISTFQKVQEITLFLNISMLRAGLSDEFYFFGQRNIETPTSFYKFQWKSMTYSGIYDYSSSINDYLITADGLYMFIAKGKSILKLDLNSGIVVKELNGSTRVSSLDADIRHTQLITSSSTGLFKWNVETSNGIPYPNILKSEKVYLSADGSYFIYLDDENLVFRKSLGLNDVSLRTGDAAITDFAIDISEKWIATVSESTEIKIWDNPFAGTSATISVSNPANAGDATVRSGADLNNEYSRSDLTEAILMQLYGSQIEADLASRKELFAPKDEFEKTSDYESRMENARRFKLSTLDSYRDRYFQDIEYKKAQDSLREVRRLAQIEDKIRNSYREVSFSIDRLGTYNADRETFPITIRGTTENIKVPISEAKEFKANYADAEVKGVEQLGKNGVDLEIFNLKIIHPITDSQYSFGQQREPLFMTGKTTPATPVSANQDRTSVPSRSRGRNQGVATVDPNADSDLTEDNLAEKLKERKNYVLLIGVDNYIDEGIFDLEYSIIDANKFVDAITSRYTFENGNILKLENPNGTDIIKAFELLSIAVKSEDNLLIIFSGHGLWDESLQEGFWLPADASVNSKSEWLSNSMIRDYIGNISSRHTLLISDACFMGDPLSIQSGSDPSKSFLELYKKPSRMAITNGSTKTEPGKSALFEGLITILNANYNAISSAAQIFSQVKNIVVSRGSSGPEPQFGEINDTGNAGGDFLFILR